MATETSGQTSGKAPAAADPSKQTPPPAQVAQANEPVKLTKSAWQERARTVFEASPHALAGALHDKADDETISEDDVRSALDEFSVAEGLSS
jgi:hypothetical protein